MNEAFKILNLAQRNHPARGLAIALCRINFIKALRLNEACGVNL